MDAFEGTLTDRVARQVQSLSMVMHNFLKSTIPTRVEYFNTLNGNLRLLAQSRLTLNPV
jgi:hypothetical protein